MGSDLMLQDSSKLFLKLIDSPPSCGCQNCLELSKPCTEPHLASGPQVRPLLITALRIVQQLGQYTCLVVAVIHITPTEGRVVRKSAPSGFLRANERPRMGPCFGTRCQGVVSIDPGEMAVDRFSNYYFCRV